MNMKGFGDRGKVIVLLSFLILIGIVHAASAYTVDETKPIGQKWVQQGGAAVVGLPTSDVITTTNGYKQGPEFNLTIPVKYQKFVNGVIVYSDRYGAVYISNAIFTKWDSLHNVASEVYGVSLFDYIGVPKYDYDKDATKETGIFERGMIVVRSATGTSFAVTGPIYGYYVNTADGVTGRLGFPTTDENAVVGGGYYQDFEHGSIYYKSSGAWAVEPGPIFDRWLALGGNAGKMGFPLSDQKPVYRDTTPPGSSVLVGWMQRFENGNIYRDANQPSAFEVTGTILDAYETKYGGPAGWLGFPMSGNSSNANINAFFNDFQNGVIVLTDLYTPNNPTIYPFGDLSVRMGHVWGYGNDQDGIGGGQDMIIKITIYVDGNLFLDRFRVPESDYGDSDFDIACEWPVAQPVRSNTNFEVIVQGWDYDPADPNDYCGETRGFYSMNNLWGINEPTTHPRAYGPDGDSMDVTWGIWNIYPFDSSKFVDSLYWSFHNFGTEELDYNQFAQTFADVGPEETWLGHPINKAFFKYVYKGIAGNGNCYGMSIEAIDAMQGKSIYSEPIFQYFGDTSDGRKLKAGVNPPFIESSNPGRDSLIRQLNVKQGYQLGAPEVIWLLKQLALGNTHNPRQVFIESKAAFDRGDYPSISITNDYFWGGGHNVLPYKWENVWDPTENWRMYVADSNNPAGGRYTTTGSQLPYTDPSFFEIEMPLSPGQWYTYSPTNIYGTNYEGGEFLGGRMFYYPYHVMDETPTTPFDGVSVGLSFLEMVIVGDTGETTQVSGNAGHTFYDPGLSGPPTRWDQINDDASGMPNLMRLPLIDAGGGSSQPEIYISTGGYGATYRYEILPREGVAAGTPYTWLFNSGTLSSVLDVPGTLNIPDAITVSQSGTPNEAVSLFIPAASQAKDIGWYIEGGVKGRYANLTKLKMVPNQTIDIHLKNGGYQLELQNTGPATTAVLWVCAEPGGTPVKVSDNFPIKSGLNIFQFDAPLTNLTYTGGQPGNAGWLLTPITVTLQPVDYSGTGINYTEYSLNGTTWIRYASPFTYAQEGITTLYYRSKDKAGNQEPMKSQVFKIDTRSPVVNVTIDKPVYTRADPFIVHFDAYDPVPGSGLASLAATLDGQTVTNGQKVDISKKAFGTHNVTAVASDVAGRNTTKIITFEIHPPPKVTAYSPTSGKRGAAAFKVAISGSEFQNGVTVSLVKNGAPTIDATSVSVSKTTGYKPVWNGLPMYNVITCYLKIPSSAPTGSRSIVVKNPDGINVTVSGFTVK